MNRWRQHLAATAQNRTNRRDRSEAGELLCLRPDTHHGRDCDLLRTVFYSMPEIAFYKNTQGGYAGCNRAFAEFVNRPADDLIGLTDCALFDESFAERIRQLELSAIESGNSQTRMLSFTATPGHTLLFEATATPLHDKDGSFVGVMGIWRDITRRVADEKRLRESEANLAAFFDCSRDFMFIIDTDGIILKANRIVHERLGYTVEELRNMHVLQLHPVEQRAEAVQILDAMAAGTCHRCPIPLMTRAGVAIPVETEVAYGMWKGQTVMFATSRDVSEQRQAEQSIQYLNAIQHQLMRFATEFVNVSLTRIDETIRDALEAMGSLINADRAYLFEYDFDAGQMSNTHEWCNTGIAPQIDRLQNLPHDLFPDWVAAHQRGELIHIPRVSELDAADPVYQTLAPQAVQSLIALPLLSPGGCIGFVGFDAVREERAWGESEIALLRVLAEVFANIKMRFKAEQELHRMNTDMRILLDTMNAQVWYLKDPETYGLVNRAHADFLGLQREAIQHRRFQEFLAPSETEVCLKSNREVFRTGEISRTQEWLRSGTGERRLFEIIKQPWTDADGQVAYAVCVAHDITEKAQLEQELIRARDEAEQTAERKAHFLADMSHEIRTPLNVILGFLQIMDRECECPKKNRLAVMRKSGEHLLDLINDILMIIRRDSSHLLLNASEFDLNRLIGDVKDLFSQNSAARHLRIESVLNKEVPRIIFADKSKVRQVLINLVGNAVKFTKRGTIRIRTGTLPPVQPPTPDGTHTDIPGSFPCRIVVEVEDSGCGIAADRLETIFDPFMQQEHGRFQKTGCGFGLPLSRRYARALGGDVTVVSEQGKGSTFAFTFDALGVLAENLPSMTSVPRRVIAPDGVCPRLLVVDDHPEGRAVQIEMLTLAGFRVDAAENGERALELLVNETPYAAVLLDKRMPGLDGYATLKRIRALPTRAHTPVLILTASGFSDESEDVRALGGDGLLPKPVTQEQFLDAIGRVTGLSYIRADMPPASTPQTGEPDAPQGQLPDMQMPQELRKRIEAAVRGGDILTLRRLVQEIHADLPWLASHVEALVEAYDYDGLLRLCRSLDCASNTEHRPAATKDVHEE
jgi:PAS domain S-box-containing protein